MSAHRGPARDPSRWPARLPVIALAAAGLAISVYLAAFQLGAAPGPWDPLFGPASSARVLRSALTRALPVPDAALGAAVYAAEAALELAGGGSGRWRRHPRLVLATAAVAAALALVGAGLVVLQAAVVRSFCTLCLCSAALSISAGLAVAAGGEPSAAARTLGWAAQVPRRR